MTTTSVRLTTVAELDADPHFQELIDEYADECALEGLPRPQHNIDLYYAMEANGALFPLAAYHEERLIGFAALLKSPNPHYGIDIMVVETLFVGKDFRRHTGAGSALKVMIKSKTTELGAPGFIINAPVGSALALQLAMDDTMRETNRSFFWKRPT